MFDVGKLAETIGGLFSGSRQDDPVVGNGLFELLRNAGIDPARLAGLDQTQIFDLLQQHGIDPGQLDASQISELLQNGNVGGNLAEMAQSWLNSPNR
jgi:hypothetical protein